MSECFQCSSLTEHIFLCDQCFKDTINRLNSNKTDKYGKGIDKGVHKDYVLPIKPSPVTVMVGICDVCSTYDDDPWLVLVKKGWQVREIHGSRLCFCSECNGKE